MPEFDNVAPKGPAFKQPTFKSSVNCPVLICLNFGLETTKDAYFLHYGSRLNIPH